MDECGLENQQELIELIYDAALHQDSWQTFLDKVVARSNSSSGLLVLQNEDNLDIGFTVQNGFFESLRNLYNHDYCIHDASTVGLSRMSREHFFPSRARLPRKGFQSSIIYNEYCRPLGIAYAAGAFIAAFGTWSIRFALQRAKSQNEFSGMQIQQLQKLLPHIKRGIRMGIEAGTYRKSFWATIERFLAPCILLGVNQKIIALNKSARLLINNHENGLVIKQERISVKATNLNNRLESIIRACYRTATTGEGKRGGLVELPRINQIPLTLSVTPFVHRGGMGFQQGDGMVALFVYDA